MLLERQPSLERMREAYELARNNSGRMVLVSGEAGVGKTSLIGEFVNSLPASSKVYWGGCEALFAARPLGPLFDIAEQLERELRQMLRSGRDTHKAFSRFLALAEGNTLAGAVFIIEDIHWADNATMDFLKYIGRRINRTRCLIVASYRDDEIGPAHPLRHLVGDLPANATDRIILAALSRQAVAELADGNEQRAAEIFEVTGGNPFFVQELLSGSGRGIPATVTDAILAKASRLSEKARLLLNLAAVVPGKCERSILESAFDNALELIDECAGQGLLTAAGDNVAFRHELARLAIEDALPAGQRSRWNAQTLAALSASKPDALARLAHHADVAGNREAVLRYAPLAARQAAELGAHREAVTLYRQALSRADAIDERERGHLLECLAYELYVTGRIDDAIRVRRQCLSLWSKSCNKAGEASSLRWLSRLHWFAGKRQDADRYAEEALRSSEALTDGPEYAMACSNRAQLYMLSFEVEPAVEWANKAIALAKKRGDVETLAHALNNLGTALSHVSVEEGAAHLRASLAMSLENEFQEHVARAYTNLSSIATSAKRYAEANTYLEAGIDYTSERDLDSWLYYMQGWRARLRFETGDWDGASDDAQTVVREYRGTGLIASPATSTLARLRVRRGDPDAEEALDTAMKSVADSRELLRIGPLVAAAAEHAWLHGEEAPDLEVLHATREWADRLHDKWLVGELEWWLHKLAIDFEPCGQLSGPWDLLLRQRDWSNAAKAWSKLGCPYESALALSEGDDTARMEALRTLSRLGAEPLSGRLRKALRAAGIKKLPKESRRSTRENPAGLTNRQLAVLTALAEGLSNAEIAARLFISPRTVDHHVSAILAKLQVQSRTEAAAAAIKMGICGAN